jgi:hypothetical protein
MDNIELSLSDDDVLTIVVDVKKAIGWTKNRTSVRIASTQGNLQLWKDGRPHPERPRMNLNIFRPLTAAEEQERTKGMVLWFE